nr:hypothetical protein [Tanacetum cinerariifolium]
MLKLHEETLPKKNANPALHAIRAGRVQKNQKNKSYKAGKGVIVKGLRGSKKLKPGALSLYVGDGHRTAVEAIGTYHLELPNGLIIILNNCHYAPSITRGVILVSRLFDDGFVNRFDDNNVISVSKNNLVYFKVVPRDGIYEIDMSCCNTNDSSMYAITDKRAKINLDSSLLWHCRLGHISKKRIEKLQHDVLLNSIDIESLGKPLLIIGGQGLILFKSTGGVPIRLSVCNPFTSQFSYLSHLQKPRANPAVGVAESCTNQFKLYVAGGMFEAATGGAASYESTLEMFDSKSNKWTVMGPMPVEFTELGVPMGDTLELATLVPHDEKVAVVGGTHDGNVLVWELGAGCFTGV